jgi:hypothetical protein
MKVKRISYSKVDRRSSELVKYTRLQLRESSEDEKARVTLTFTVQSSGPETDRTLDRVERRLAEMVTAALHPDQLSLMEVKG